jgi:hypothetical protein
LLATGGIIRFLSPTLRKSKFASIQWDRNAQAQQRVPDLNA